jgi:hypothetical protein
LHRDTFQILVCLADRDCHGYSILRDIEERTGDVRSITPSTLYSSIHREIGKTTPRPARKCAETAYFEVLIAPEGQTRAKSGAIWDEARGQTGKANFWRAFQHGRSGR